MSRPWIETARGLMAHLRSRGWACVLRGHKLAAVGMAGPRMIGMKANNDNSLPGESVNK